MKGTNKTKHINSSLTDDVNITVVMDKSSTYSCDQLTQITYTSDTGTYTQTWTGDTARDLCSDVTGTITINYAMIEPATSSNIFDIQYVELDPICQKIQEGFGNFGELLILIVLAIVVVIVLVLFGEGKMDWKGLLGASIIALVFAAIINIIGSIIVAGLC